MKKETNNPKPEFLFGKRNYIIMLIGVAVIALGFILMAGGGSDDPNVFNDEIFNARRITWAPLMLIIGLVIEVYAIMASNSSNG